MDHTTRTRLLDPDQASPIRTVDDLQELWRGLSGPLAFDARHLWVVFLAADGRPLPVLPRFDEPSQHPTRTFLLTLTHICRNFLHGEGHADGSAAFLLSRPGSKELTTGDRAWASGLCRATARADLRPRPFFVATGEGIASLDTARGSALDGEEQSRLNHAA